MTLNEFKEWLQGLSLVKDLLTPKTPKKSKPKKTDTK